MVVYLCEIVKGGEHAAHWELVPYPDDRSSGTGRKHYCDEHIHEGLRKMGKGLFERK